MKNKKEKIAQALKNTANDFDQAARGLRDQVEQLKKDMAEVRRIDEKLKKLKR